MNVGNQLTCINIEPLKGNDIAPPLENGKDYPLEEIHKCSCGKEHYNVGLKMTCAFVTCHSCKEELPSHTHWACPTRFVLAK